MEAWSSQLHRRRDLDAAAAAEAAAASHANAMDVYALRDVDIDKPVKKPQTIEAVLTSRVAWGDVAPPLVFTGTSDGTLHCYVPAAGASQTGESAARDMDELASLCWHASYRRLAHACAQFLDSWGVYLTLSDTKLALYTLPLQHNSQVDSSASSSLMRGIGIGSMSNSSSSNGDAMLTVVDETKQTTLFAAHEGAHVVCCVSKQHTLRVFDWTADRTLALRAQHELPLLLTPAQSLPVQQLFVMGESHVFVQLKRGWCVLNVDSGRVLDVRAADADAALSVDAVACAVAVPRDRESARQQHASHELRDVFVAGRHEAAVVTLAVVDDDGEDDGNNNTASAIDATRRADPQSVSDDRVCVAVTRVLEYAAAPRTALFHHPLLLLEYADALAVYNIGTMRLVQRVAARKPLLGAAAVVALDAPQLGSASESVSAAAATLLTVTASPFAIQLLTMQRVERLVRNELAHGRQRDALALCRLCPADCGLSDVELRTLLATYARAQFAAGQFRHAMALFLESGVDVLDVLIALYPRDLLPRSSSSGSSTSSTTSLLKPTPRAVALTGEPLVQSLRALMLLLYHQRDALAHSSSSSNSTVSIATATADRSLEVIDTVLLKCLVLLCETHTHAPRARTELLALVARPNWIDLAEAEVSLRAHSQLAALLQFYATRKEHRKALELLEDLERTASANEKAAALASSPSADALTDSSTTLETAASYLAQTTAYLQRLGQRKAELVFEFSRRVLAVTPSLGLAIFTDRRVPEAKDDLDVARVLQHLKTCELPLRSSTEGSSNSGRNSDSTDTVATITEASGSTPLTLSGVVLPLIDAQFVAIEYLTHVIAAAKTPVAPRLHDEVVYLLLDAINTELRNSSSSSRSSTTGTTGAHATRLTGRVSAQRGLVGTLRRKLLAFLESDSAAYHPERMLSRTPVEMVDERAALLARLGRHHEVLQLYAIDLRDAALAERYCDRCYCAKVADASIYSALLRLYLRPLPAHLAAMASPGKPNSNAASPPLLWRSSSSSSTSSHAAYPSNDAVAAAVNVLNKYPERIDVATALALLPADVPVASLATFFRRVLERQVERYRNGQVKKQLAKMANFTVRQALSTKRRGSVTVWSSHCCDVCGKKLGTGTFVRLPSGALLHYACQPAS